MKVKVSYQMLMYCLISFFFSGCSGVNFTQWRFPYMYRVQQGNYINQQEMAQLSPGMTKDQVTFIIGHPVSQFMFNANQWQYIYQTHNNNKLDSSYIININFDAHGKLASVESAGEVFVK